MKRYIKSENVIPTYIGQLPDRQQRYIRQQLIGYGLEGSNLQDAMDSKISDITGNPESPIDTSDTGLEAWLVDLSDYRNERPAVFRTIIVAKNIREMTEMVGKLYPFHDLIGYEEIG